MCSHSSRLQELELELELEPASQELELELEPALAATPGTSVSSSSLFSCFLFFSGGSFGSPESGAEAIKMRSTMMMMKSFMSGTMMMIR